VRKLLVVAIVVALMVTTALVVGSLFGEADLVSALVIALPGVLIVLLAGRRHEGHDRDDNPTA
jgi:hypothetical protein